MDNQPNGYPQEYEPWGALTDIVPVMGAALAIMLVIVAAVKFFGARAKRVSMIYEAAARQNLMPITVEGLWPTAYARMNGRTKLLLMGDHLHVEELWNQPNVLHMESLATPKNV